MLRIRRKAFTILELTLTIGIIAILMAMAAQNFQSSKNRAYDVNLRSGTSAYRVAFELHHTIYHTYSVYVRPELTDTCALAYRQSAEALTAYRTSGSGSGCVGYDGSGEGKITRRDVQDAYYPGDYSIADALVKEGILSRIEPYPGVATFSEEETGGTSYNDYVLTLCDKNGKEAVQPAQASRFAIYAQLKLPSDADTAAANQLCGGSGTDQGWDTTQAVTFVDSGHKANLNFGVGS